MLFLWVSKQHLIFIRAQEHFEASSMLYLFKCSKLFNTAIKHAMIQCNCEEQQCIVYGCAPVLWLKPLCFISACPTSPESEGVSAASKKHSAHFQTFRPATFRDRSVLAGNKLGHIQRLLDQPRFKIVPVDGSKV